MTIDVARLAFLYCHRCGKQVSTGFYAVPTDTPDHGIIVRAWIECPECLDAHAEEVTVKDAQP